MNRVLIFIYILCTSFYTGMINGQTFGPKTTNDTIRLTQLTDYVSKNHFSKVRNIELYAAQAIELAKQLNQTQTLASLYQMMGVIQYFNGQYDKALNNFLEAVKLFQSLKDIRGEASTYNEIGNVYRKHKRQNEALQILNKAYTLAASIRDSGTMAKSLNLSGIVYEEMDDLKTATAKYQQALKLYVAIRDSIGQSYAYENIGGIYLMQGQYDEAEAYIIESLKIREESHLDQAVAMSYHYLGELYQKKGELQRSRAMFEAAMALGRDIDYPDIVQRSFFSLAATYKLEKNFAKAYEFYEKGTLLKDSLFNVEKSQQLAELQTKYEVGTQKQENLLLKQNNELGKQQVQNKNLQIFFVLFVFITLGVISLFVYRKRQQGLAIQTQLRIQKAEQQQRIRISHDLHDHVGAQLSYVVSNLDIASQEIDNKELDARRIQSITEMSKQAISTLRETVWALNNEHISIESFADKFKAYARKMSDLSEGIRLEFKEEIAHDCILMPNTALHLFRICQEGFSNALKHANCSVISIYIGSDAGSLLVFRLADNGAGFDPEEARRKGHYGLENMAHRAAEVGASYKLSTEKGKGTQIELVLPKNTTYA